MRKPLIFGGLTVSDPSPVAAPAPRVALFVTCLVDLFRPSVGFAAVKLLEESGCVVDVPSAQTCCGQPAWNSGDRATAAAIACDVVAAFEGYDYVVAPSGSCAATLIKDYPEILSRDLDWKARAVALASKTHELVSFLTDVRGMERPVSPTPGHYTYHDSCSGLRSLSVKRQPRDLLIAGGAELVEMEDAEVCCGFGGTFCVKYPDVSNAMVERKTEAIVASGAETILAGDLGCLLNIAGKLKRQGAQVSARHVAEVLAGVEDNPGIGEGT